MRLLRSHLQPLAKCRPFQDARPHIRLPIFPSPIQCPNMSFPPTSYPLPLDHHPSSSILYIDQWVDRSLLNCWRITTRFPSIKSLGKFSCSSLHEVSTQSQVLTCRSILAVRAFISRFFSAISSDAYGKCLVAIAVAETTPSFNTRRPEQGFWGKPRCYNHKWLHAKPLLTISKVCLRDCWVFSRNEVCVALQIPCFGLDSRRANTFSSIIMLEYYGIIDIKLDLQRTSLSKLIIEKLLTQ